MSLSRKISDWWFERLFERDARWLCKFFGLTFERTKIWQYLHTAYNPIASIDSEEFHFEDIYLRRRHLPRNMIRRMIVVFLVRSQEIVEIPTAWVDWTPLRRGRFLRFMSFDQPLNCMKLTCPSSIPKDDWYFEKGNVMSSNVIKRIKPLYVIGGSIRVDETSPTLRKAAKDFCDRVNTNDVYGEIVNANLRNNNGHMDGLNDNVCVRIANASFDKKEAILSFELVPCGPAKHVLDNVPDALIQSWIRGTVEMSGMGNTLKEIRTIDVYIESPKGGSQ